MKLCYFLTLMISISLLIAGCGGGLSNEQRKALKEEMKEREIKKIAEEDIVAETFKQGQRLFKYHQTGADSLLKTMNANIYLLQKGDSISNKIDWDLFEAYQYSLTNGGRLVENVQRDGEEMIYTMPFVKNDTFQGVYVIRIPRKEIILGL